MANLKGSVKTTEELKGSVKKEFILQGSITKIYHLVGRVESFLRSLTIRAFIQPVASLYANVIAYRYAKANMMSKSSLYARLITLREIKNLNITARSSITFNPQTDRNVTAVIQARSVFGKDTILELVDNFTLDQLDNSTLGELEFTQGVYVNVVKSVTANILSVAQITANVYTFRYNKLELFDDSTLDSIDSTTLNDLDETLN